MRRRRQSRPELDPPPSAEAEALELAGSPYPAISPASIAVMVHGDTVGAGRCAALADWASDII